MKVEVTKQPKATVELKIVVPNAKVKEAHDLVFAEVVKQTEIKGFRKGQAPAELVKEKTDVSKLYGEVINTLLQTHYPQALKEHLIQPVANPKVEIKEFDLEKDFEFVATVAVKPEVKIGNYKPKIEKAFEDKKAQLKKINEEKLKKGDPLSSDHVHLNADDVMQGLVETSEIEIADLIVEDETERMLARLINQAQSIGLSLDQYLKSINKTADQLKEDYRKISERNIKAEFILAQLVDEQNITVSDEEVEQMVKASGDPNAQNTLNDPTQKLYVKSIIGKNKVITNIIKEIEGDEFHAEHQGGQS